MRSKETSYELITIVISLIGCLFLWTFTVPRLINKAYTEYNSYDKYTPEIFIIHKISRINKEQLPELTIYGRIDGISTNKLLEIKDFEKYIETYNEYNTTINEKTLNVFYNSEQLPIYPNCYNEKTMSFWYYIGTSIFIKIFMSVIITALTLLISSFTFIKFRNLNHLTKTDDYKTN